MGDGLYKLPTKAEDVPDVIEVDADPAKMHLAISTKPYDAAGVLVSRCQRIDIKAKRAKVLRVNDKGRLVTVIGPDHYPTTVADEVDATGWRLEWPNGFSVTV